MVGGAVGGSIDELLSISVVGGIGFVLVVVVVGCVSAGR